MSKHNHNGRMNATSWQQVKNYLRLNNISEVREMTGRGIGTIIHVRDSENFEDYIKLTKRTYQYYKARREKFEIWPKVRYTLEGHNLPGYKETAIIASKLPKRKYTKQKVVSGIQREAAFQQARKEYDLTTVISLLEQLVKNTQPPKRMLGFLWW